MGDFWVVTPNCGALASPLILGAGDDHTIREISTLLLFPPLSLGHFLPVSSPFSSKQAPLNKAGRSGERCKRSQRSLGRCASRNRIRCILARRPRLPIRLSIHYGVYLVPLRLYRGEFQH